MELDNWSSIHFVSFYLWNIFGNHQFTSSTIETHCEMAFFKGNVSVAHWDTHFDQLYQAINWGPMLILHFRWSFYITIKWLNMYSRLKVVWFKNWYRSQNMQLKLQIFQQTTKNILRVVWWFFNPWNFSENFKCAQVTIKQLYLRLLTNVLCTVKISISKFSWNKQLANDLPFFTQTTLVTVSCL